MEKNYYINIRSYDNKIALTYFLPDRLSYRETPLKAFTDLRNIKNRILWVARDLNNEEIILKNTERLEDGDRPFNNKKLERLCKKLNKEVANANFKLAA